MRLSKQLFVLHLIFVLNINRPYLTPQLQGKENHLHKSHDYEVALNVSRFDIVKSALGKTYYDADKCYWDNAQKLPQPPPLPADDEKKLKIESSDGIYASINGCNENDETPVEKMSGDIYSIPEPIKSFDQNKSETNKENFENEISYENIEKIKKNDAEN